MITVSIVSHGHGSMVRSLVSQVVKCPEVECVIVTLNIPEEFDKVNSKLIVVKNENAHGFSVNHNNAFKISKSKYFCVLNPDVILIGNPFPALIKLLHVDSVGLVAPVVINKIGRVQDSMRKRIDLLGLIKRLLKVDAGIYLIEPGIDYAYPDWVAGLFMLFNADAYEKVCGFDEGYYMYCEDADICQRIKLLGYQIIVSGGAKVLHDGKRDSHRKFKYFIWHLKSIARLINKRHK